MRAKREEEAEKDNVVSLMREIMSIGEEMQLINGLRGFGSSNK